MSIFDDKSLKSVAEAVMKVMQQEELKGNQHKIDANKNGKVDKHDFKLLRKETAHPLDEAAHSSRREFDGERSHKDAMIHARSMHNALVSKGYKTNDINHLSRVDKDRDAVYKHSSKPTKTMAIRHMNMGHPTMQSSSVSLHSKTSKLGEEYINPFDEMKEGMESDSKLSQQHQSIRSKNPKLPKNPNYYKELGATYDIEDDAKRSAAQTELKKKHGMKEEVEQLQEYESKSGVYRNKGTYGGSKGTEYGNTDWDKEESDSKKMPEKPKASRKLGARQNFVRARRVNESFTQMVTSYQENGLKSLADMVSFDEEVDNETYEKEMKDQKMKFDGKKKGADVAKASVQAVKVEEETHTEIQVIDMTDADNIKKEIIDIAELEERTLTEPETKKKEEIVKSMKKNMQGFRERYGKDGKSVAYATATKIAKEKA